ncbi:guanine deaminase [Desulfuribacillus stibiiarsenatis]|uniref:Guanine deaminase n=1 Tax=Desulfuribacillus stibiiarsenatis TaxID=1390249 RepID=A0A1E5L5P1_9FIRM|nr:guanine deaminase [Desulfuribacillus stibiiarsenatis]OEH85323.1 guanine deaminase [Desulfuribacillus stibiiarsenatis]
MLRTENTHLLKGNFIYTPTSQEIQYFENAYLVCVEGIVRGIYQSSDELPESVKDLPIEDYSNHLVIPGFVDLHVHAAQYYQRGIGLDKELIAWLEEYTFPGEAKFADEQYAEQVYHEFITQLLRQGTTRASILATIHKHSTDCLFQIAEDIGMHARIGKINMDQNCPEFLRETTEQSLIDTEELILAHGQNKYAKPIITPRFVPTCSAALLQGLGELAKQYQVPIQSHLSENRDEVRWVKSLYPNAVSYGHVYHQFQLFGHNPTLMAHGVYLEEQEIALMKEQQVMIVHCPEANLNLASGIMPVKKLLEQGLAIGLGSDVGAGHNLSMMKIMVQAMQSSKALQAVQNQLTDQATKVALSLSEVLYMATKGGGRFFGKVGSFEEGYCFDAIVIDDRNLGPQNIPLSDRLQRLVYIGDDRNIVQRFIDGREVRI